MNNNIKKTVNFFKKKYKLKKINFSNLKKVAVEMGYTIIEFNSTYNENDVETVIQTLNLRENITKARGFTYVSTDYRLIFINENLNDEEKLIVLAHELGHIVCEHISTSHIIGNDVKEEYEANEFAHYLLKQGKFRKVKNIMAAHRKILIVSIIVLCLIAGLSTAYLIVQNKNLYTDDLYVTTTGNCYHKKECIFVKNKTNIQKVTKAEFENGTYSPCDICLPDYN